MNTYSCEQLTSRFLIDFLNNYFILHERKLVKKTIQSGMIFWSLIPIINHIRQSVQKQLSIITSYYVCYFIFILLYLHIGGFKLRINPTCNKFSCQMTVSAIRTRFIFKQLPPTCPLPHSDIKKNHENEIFSN